MATELKEPARSLCVRQILSTKDESDGLSSKVKIMLLFPIYAEPDSTLLKPLHNN
jgi:hypothetical protein